MNEAATGRANTGIRGSLRAVSFEAESLLPRNAKQCRWFAVCRVLAL